MGFFRSLNGMARLTVTSADLAGALTVADQAGIPVFSTVSTDDLTAQLLLRRQDTAALIKTLERRGDIVKPAGRLGIFWTLKGLFRRPVLVLGIAALVFLSSFIPSRIWFFRVEGNESIPARQILEQAELCGISFGASRREVRSEKVKNALLQALPELQWAGINTSGCVATVSVWERQPQLPQTITQGVSSIVAARDGLILSCTVTKGSAACAVGQAVQEGQVLISGYTDCGLTIRASRAEGEIFARTEHKMTAIAPTSYQMRTGNTRQIKKYSLILGKKRINFYKDSGILDVSCDKMIVEQKLTLPGGFYLPVTLITEIWEYSDCEVSEIMEQDLSGFASRYLSEHMVAGQILSAEESVTASDGITILEGTYACREMIGRVQNEEIIKPNGND